MSDPRIFTIPPLGDGSIKQIATESGVKDSILDTATKLASGNPGAINEIVALAKINKDVDVDLFHLDKMGLVGSDIWIGYKDICQFDVKLFSRLIRDETIKGQIEALPYYHG
jgi:hypothetical protein